MAKVTLQGNEVNTTGDFFTKGRVEFDLVANDLSVVSLNNITGKKIVLNIFPSIDTPTCATSVREFNKAASDLGDVKVYNISKDLPFAQARFCGAEGIDNVETLSDFRSPLGECLGVLIADGPLKGLLARAVIVLNEEHDVIYSELVSEIAEEPNYAAALASLK